jgi:hypothetical protein
MDEREAIKALEEYISVNSEDVLLSNKGITYGDLLNLIRRLKTENKLWREVAGSTEQTYRLWHRTAELNAAKIIELYAEIDKLKNLISQGNGILPEYEKMIRAEAVREFAKRIKSHYPNSHSVLQRIDTIEQEMVGEKGGANG